MYTLIRALLLVTGLTIIGGEETCYRITKNLHSPGIYFESLPPLYQVTDHWNIVSYLDISELRRLLRMSGDLKVGSLYNHCMTMLADCDELLHIKRIQDRERRITDALSGIEEYLSQSPESFSTDKDSKAWFLNSSRAIGANETKNYYHMFAEDEKSGSMINYYPGNKTIVIRSDLEHPKNVIYFSYIRLKGQADELRNMHSEQKYFDFNNYRNRLANWSSMMEDLEDRFLFLLQDVHEVITASEAGILHPKAIIPRMFEQSIASLRTITFPSKFPSSSRRVSLGDLEQVSELRTTVYRNRFIFKLRIPILEENPHFLYEVHAHPVPQLIQDQTVLYAYVEPQFRYLLVSPNRTHYTDLTQREVDECYNDESFLICDLRTSYKLIKHSNQCEVNLITDPNNNTYKDCKVQINTNRKQQWETKSLRNGLIYTSPTEIQGIITNQTTRVEEKVKVNGTGTILIQTGCTLDVDNTFIIGRSDHITTNRSDIVPSLDLDIYEIYPHLRDDTFLLFYSEYKYIYNGIDLNKFVLESRKQTYVLNKLDDLSVETQFLHMQIPEIEQSKREINKLKMAFFALSIASVLISVLCLIQFTLGLHNWIRGRRHSKNSANRAQPASHEFQAHFFASPPIPPTGSHPLEPFYNEPMIN